MVEPLRHRQTKEAATDMCDLRHRAASRLYPSRPCLENSCPRRPKRWGNRPASLWIAEDFGCCAQADGETRSVEMASSIRRRSAAWTILLDYTFRSMRRVSALWMTRAVSCEK